MLWLEDGDHDLKPRKAVTGLTAQDHLRTVAAAVAAWVERTGALTSGADRDLQHQRRQPAADQPARLAGRDAARRRVPAGAEGRRAGLSARGDRARGLRRGLAQPVGLERRRDPRARTPSRSSRAPTCPATPTTASAATSRRRCGGCSSLRSMRRTATRSRGRSSTTSWPGWRRLAGACGGTAGRRRAGRAGGRLQRRARAARTSIRPRSYDDNAVVQPAPRAAFRGLLEQGWIDAVRRLRPDGPCYTFWDYRRDRWRRDAGLRLDHLLLSPGLGGRAARRRRRSRRARRGSTPAIMRRSGWRSRTPLDRQATSGPDRPPGRRIGAARAGGRHGDDQVRPHGS